MLLNLSNIQYIRLVELLALAQKQLQKINHVSDLMLPEEDEYQQVIQHVFKYGKKMQAHNALEQNHNTKLWQTTEALDEYLSEAQEELLQAELFVQLGLQMAVKEALLKHAHKPKLPDINLLTPSSDDIISTQLDIINELQNNGLMNFEFLNNADLRARHPGIKSAKRLGELQKLMADTLVFKLNGKTPVDLTHSLNEDATVAPLTQLNRVKPTQATKKIQPIKPTPFSNVVDFPAPKTLVKNTRQVIKLAQQFYTLKVTLKDSKPIVWRRLQIVDSCPLSVLHHIIQISFDWHDSHLHSFSVGNVHYESKEHIANDDFNQYETHDEAGVWLKDVLRKPKDKLLYEYDFGDGWELNIVLESIQAIETPISTLKSLVHCLTGKRAGALEDIGGVWALNDIVAAIEKNQQMPPHLEHDLQIQLYNPSLFCADELNKRLHKAQYF